MKLEEVLNDALQAEFCKEQGYDGLHQEGNKVIAFNYEVIESYYGHSLIEPCITDVFTLEELEEWKNLKEVMYHNI